MDSHFIGSAVTGLTNPSEYLLAGFGTLGTNSPAKSRTGLLLLDSGY